MASNLYTLINDRISAIEKIVDSITLEDHKRKLIKTNWIDFIRLMESLSKRHFIRYNILNLTTIIAGILIPVTINVISDPYIAKITGTVLGVLVSISASINQSYRFNDRWRHFRLIAEELKIEGEKYLSLSEKYKDFESHDRDAFKTFMANIENIKEGQISFFMRKITHSDSKEDKLNKGDE